MIDNKDPVAIADEIYHHGIKGMKWGVRRYQNKDGSLTDLGKKRLVDSIRNESEGKKTAPQVVDTIAKKVFGRPEYKKDIKEIKDADRDVARALSKVLKKYKTDEDFEYDDEGYLKEARSKAEAYTKACENLINKVVSSKHREAFEYSINTTDGFDFDMDMYMQLAVQKSVGGTRTIREDVGSLNEFKSTYEANGYNYRKARKGKLVSNED